MDRLGIEFEGTPHRAGDDAYNIAKILREMTIPLMDNPNYNKDGH